MTKKQTDRHWRNHYLLGRINKSKLSKYFLNTRAVNTEVITTQSICNNDLHISVNTFGHQATLTHKRHSIHILKFQTWKEKKNKTKLSNTCETHADVKNHWLTHSIYQSKLTADQLSVLHVNHSLWSHTRYMLTSIKSWKLRHFGLAMSTAVCRKIIRVLCQVLGRQQDQITWDWLP